MSNTKQDNLGKPARENTFMFRAGWMICDCSRAYGGVQYDRQVLSEHAINKGHGLSAEYVTHKTIDHVTFCAEADALVKRVAYVLRKFCTRTELGWFADEDALVQVRREVARIKEEAHTLNTEVARRARSARRVRIHIVPLKLDFAHEETAKEIVSTIRQGLTDFRDALRCGDIASLHKIRIRTLRLDRLATGFQADAIKFALQRVPTAAGELRAAIANGKTATQAGADLDLEVFDAAIAHFDSAVGEDDPLTQLAAS